MSEARTSVLRKATPAEELAKLGPIERFLIRVFEFCASVKLAVVLMGWLMVECAAGTFVESNVNTPAAKYFVYGNWRFTLLLALLALNIMCAALIRFPWKRYQTGFVVTHIGLLVLLAGSMMTAQNNLDVLMSVPQGKTESTTLNPDYEQIIVRYSDRKDPVAVSFEPGPFTWGHQIFGVIPWRKDYVEEHKLKGGDILRIKRFFANCEPEQTYVSAEDGIPALRYRLYHPERADVTQWLAAEGEQLMGADSLGVGQIVFWKIETPAELDHFVHAVPKNPRDGMLGMLGYSHGGKHHQFKVDELRKAPVKVPDSNITLRISGYFPNGRIDEEGKWANDDAKGSVPNNPVVVIQVKEGDKEEKEFVAFGALQQFSRLIAAKFGTEHLFTYFPADQPTVIQLVMTPDGKTGYRAFGSEGLIASELLEMDKEYPSWAGLTFVPLEAIAHARPDIKIRPKSIVKGKKGNHAIVAELISGKDSAKTSLVLGAGNTLSLGDRRVNIRYDVQQDQVPFSIRLDEFEEPTNPGTEQAAMYTSKVTLIDDGASVPMAPSLIDRLFHRSTIRMSEKAEKVEKEQVITMNAPLHYEGRDGIDYTLYQSGIDRSTGTPISTYTVAYDPGLHVKYAGAIIMCVGIILMFYMGGYFRTRRKKGPPGAAKTRESFDENDHLPHAGVLALEN